MRRPKLAYEGPSRQAWLCTHHVRARGGVLRKDYRIAEDVDWFFRQGGTVALFRKLSRACRKVGTLIWALWDRGRWRALIADLEHEERLAIQRRQKTSRGMESIQEYTERRVKGSRSLSAGLSGKEGMAVALLEGLGLTEAARGLREQQRKWAAPAAAGVA